jgi:hypothetical protein
MSCSIGDGLHGEGSRKAVSRGGWWPIVAVVAVGVAVAGWMRPIGQVQALTSLANDAFAVCTLPLDGTNEGVFILDFETGDLSGAILNPTTGRFGVSYKHNVLADLGFKPGQVKNPKFLLVSGVMELRQPPVPVAPSVLYVTDSTTGATVVYGIPWNTQQAQAGQQIVAKLLPLDIAKPRGGGPARPAR